uniref:Protein kinase domain-containing protein n=1 Tax=Salix viminalis TaxID=40686 RepID=A0A6N2LYE9_SALVM
MDGVSSNEAQKLDEPSVPWRPRKLAFGQYRQESKPANKGQSLRVVVRSPLVARLTKDIVETYQICNPQFKYSEELNPKRYLTSPSAGVLNDGHDNVNSDLISDCELCFGQFRHTEKVAKCGVAEINRFVAVKIIKNQPAYYQQALVEVSILTTLNKKYDPDDKHHIVRIYDHFQHLTCKDFRYELIKINQFRGLSLSIVQLFSKQILRGLALLKDAGIIHCDLKPENILLCTSVKPAGIKIIDFGSACMEDRTVYSYIQNHGVFAATLIHSRYSTAIDMWSFGCIVAELFLGLPLFPGASEFDLLRRMIEIIGLAISYLRLTLCHVPWMGDILIELKKPSIGKEYFHHMNLEAIVINYPFRKILRKKLLIPVFYHIIESQIRLALIDFLRGLVEFDPAKRWSPFQASKHPFVTGEPFTCPFKPPSETPRMPVAQNIQVDHHQVEGIGSLLVSSCVLLFLMFEEYLPCTLGASAGSPGHYGPTSPVRSCSHGSPLGKMAAVTQFNRRTRWGYSGSSQSQECIPSSNWQGQSTDSAYSNNHAEGGSSLAHRQSSWMQQGGSGSITCPSAIQSIPCPNMKCPQSAGPIHDKLETNLSLPDPGDWDPNYSDELLLQEDGSDTSFLSSEFSNSMHLGSGDPMVGVGRSNRASNANSSSLNQRQNGLILAFSHVNVGSPPSSHDFHAGYGRSMSKPSNFTPHVSQNSPSRLGQQPHQRFSHGRPVVRGSEWNPIKVPPPSSSFSSGGQRSPGSSSLNNSMPWGRRANLNSIPPPSRGRKDLGRIT